ncbi:MAG: hypothetical protein AB7U43_05625 [Desulfobacter sp.]
MTNPTKTAPIASPDNRIAMALINARRRKKRDGKAEYIKFLKGERLTRNQSIRAKAFECIGDGEACSVVTCALIPYCQFADTSHSTLEHLERDGAGECVDYE